MSFLRKDASMDDRSSVRPLLRSSRWPRGIRGLFFALCFLLVMEAAGYHLITTLPAFAASPLAEAEGINTLESFLDNAQKQHNEPFERPAPLVLTPTDARNAADADMTPTVEPATMRLVAFLLDASFLLNQPRAPVADHHTELD